MGCPHPGGFSACGGFCFVFALLPCSQKPLFLYLSTVGFYLLKGNGLLRVQHEGILSKGGTSLPPPGHFQELLSVRVLSVQKLG